MKALSKYTLFCFSVSFIRNLLNSENWLGFKFLGGKKRYVKFANEFTIKVLL